MDEGLARLLMQSSASVGPRIQQSFDQSQQKRALGDFAQHPDDPRSLADLMRISPELGMQAQEYAQKQRKYTQEQQAGQLQQRAAAGDTKALAQLAGIDLDAWSKLDDRAKAKLKEGNDFIGQAALAVSQLPEEQRPAAWDSYIDHGAQSGHPELAQYKGHYSPQALQEAMASAGIMDKFLQSQKLEWHQQGELPSFATRGGTGALVDPQAVMGAGAVTPGPGPSPAGDIPTMTPEQARAAPPGTVFRSQDGRVLKVPGGAPGNTPAPTFPQ